MKILQKPKACPKSATKMTPELLQLILSNVSTYNWNISLKSLTKSVFIKVQAFTKNSNEKFCDRVYF